MKNNLLLKSYTLWKFSYIFKIVLLLFLQVILGYFIIIVAYFTVKNNVNIFSLVSYLFTLVAIVYTVYCYYTVYNLLKKEFPHFLKLIKTGLVLFYIVSLISYTFVSGSYSPFFLIGIKLAEIQVK